MQHNQNVTKSKNLGFFQCTSLIFISKNDHNSVFGSRIFIQPGTFASIGLKQVQHKKLPAPFASNCIQFWNETHFDQMTQKIMDAINERLLKYHPQSCQAICRINKLVDVCGCVWSQIDPARFSSLYQVRRSFETFQIRLFCNHFTSALQKPMCKEFLWADLGCLLKHDISVKETTRVCNCQEACDMISYDVSYSSSEWPSFEVFKSEALKVGVSSNNYTKSTNSVHQLMAKRKMLGQVARVNIFFESNQRTVIEQSAKFESFWSFFITWSGAMSIYLGVSAMAIIGLILSLWQNLRNFFEC